MSKHSQSKHSQTVNGRWLGCTIPLHARFSTRPPVEGRPEFRAERRGTTNHSTSQKPQGWTGCSVRRRAYQEDCVKHAATISSVSRVGPWRVEVPFINSHKLG